MIIKNVCLLLEALSIVICLHHLYGEKFRLDIATVSLLAVDMIMMQTIDYFGIPSTVSILIYPVIAVYCGLKFGFRLKELVVNMILCVVIVGGVQLVVAMPFYYLGDTALFSDEKLLLMNFLAVLMMVFLLTKCNIKKLLSNLKDKNRILIIAVGVVASLVLFCLISYKKFKLLELEQAVLLFISTIFIFILSGQLNKYKVRAKEIETELRMQKLYAESVQGLIDNIRLRQHEFDNHINTIYSQHYTCCTFEELVNEQRNYCEMITGENRFSKILSLGNSVIIGFLYVRFVQIDKKGIDITYKISIKDMEIGIPSYKIIEILGDLINNAVEALQTGGERKRLYVSVVEDDCFTIEIRNESPYIDYKELGLFFAKDYSHKGENRGLGLYNVKKICEEYDLNISCRNIEIDESNWLSFKLWKEKKGLHNNY